MTAYNYMDAEQAGLVEGVGDARTVDPAILMEEVGFGKPLFGYRGDTNPRAWGYKADTAKISIATDLVTSNASVVTVNGVAAATITYATSHAATIAALVAAIKAIPVSTANPYGVDAILDPADTNNRTILVRTKGVANTTSWAITGGTPPTINAVTYASGQIFLGIRHFRQGDPSVSPKAGDPVDALRIGSIRAVSASGTVNGDAAYVNASNQFATSGSAISTARYSSNYNSTTGLVRVEVSGRVPMTYGAIAF